MRYRIMVVDDDKQMLEELKDLLESQGYNIVTAQDSESAMAHARDGGYDVALVDIKMPGITGIELVGMLRQIEPDGVHVIMTAYASLDTALHAMRERAYEYLIKPFSPVELVDVVQRALAERAALEGRAQEIVKIKEEKDAAEKKYVQKDMLNEILMKREDRILELKREVNSLLVRLGEKEKYAV